MGDFVMSDEAAAACVASYTGSWPDGTPYVSPLMPTEAECEWAEHFGVLAEIAA